MKKKWYVKFQLSKLKLFYFVALASILIYILGFNQTQQQQLVTIQEANAVVGSQETLYSALILKNLYLPDYSSAAITCQYLLDVALKVQLYEELQKICDQKNIILGFDQQKMPDKKWLINVLNTLNSTAESFKMYQDQENVIGISRDDLNQPIKAVKCFNRSKQIYEVFKRNADQVKRFNNLEKEMTLVNAIAKEKKKNLRKLNNKFNFIK